MKAVIFLNGEYNYSRNFFQEIINEETDIYCADGGANYCLKYGYIPKYIYGDLDSIKHEVLEKIKYLNIEIKKFPPEKDFSDFELILEEMDNEKYSEIYVVGALGKRTDFSLNNILLMEKYKNLCIINENEKIFFKDSNFSIFNEKNKILSIISLDEKIESLTLEGVKYPLLNKKIHRSSSLLMSNIILSNEVKISFTLGKLIIILHSG